MNPNATRTSHPSSAQVETLVEFMERNPGLAKGFLRTQNARERSRRQWEELSVRLNSLGGTIKNYKQWTKYWADKKSAIKKKVAVRSAARRRTGGGVEDEVELSELEERIVALCGGEGFSTGDVHLGIHPFPEINTPSPSNEAIQDAGPDNNDVLVPQQQSPPMEVPPANMLISSEQIGSGNSQHNNRLSVQRRLFNSSSSPAVGTSQSILQDFQLVDAHTYHPSLSPPRATLSHTPTPLPMPTPSPSRRGSTQVVGHTATSSSRRAIIDTQSRTTTSPSRQNRTRMFRARRGASSVSSHRSVVAPPPSQRRTEFSTFTERFLRVEEQQLEIQRSNAQILQSFLERSGERERLLTEAVTAMGKGLEALAHAIKRDDRYLNAVLFNKLLQCQLLFTHCKGDF